MPYQVLSDFLAVLCHLRKHHCIQCIALHAHSSCISDAHCVSPFHPWQNSTHELSMEHMNINAYFILTGSTAAEQIAIILYRSHLQFCDCLHAFIRANISFAISSNLYLNSMWTNALFIWRHSMDEACGSLVHSENSINYFIEAAKLDQYQYYKYLNDTFYSNKLAVRIEAAWKLVLFGVRVLALSPWNNWCVYCVYSGLSITPSLYSRQMGTMYRVCIIILSTMAEGSYVEKWAGCGMAKCRRSILSVHSRNP